MEYVIYSYSSRNILNKDFYNVFILLFFPELSGFVIFQLVFRKYLFKLNSQINTYGQMIEPEHLLKPVFITIHSFSINGIFLFL